MLSLVDKIQAEPVPFLCVPVFQMLRYTRFEVSSEADVVKMSFLVERIHAVLFTDKRRNFLMVIIENIAGDAFKVAKYE